MSSPEDKAYEIMRELDVNYVLVIFGGLTGYASDGRVSCCPYAIIWPSCVDINKFLWMVRIGGSTDKGRHIKENDYFTPQGEFRVDREGSPILLNCLMYKMCYYRFGQVYTEQGKSVTPWCMWLSHVCSRQTHWLWSSKEHRNWEQGVFVHLNSLFIIVDDVAGLWAGCLGGSIYNRTLDCSHLQGERPAQSRSLAQ